MIKVFADFFKDAIYNYLIKKAEAYELEIQYDIERLERAYQRTQFEKFRLELDYKRNELANVSRNLSLLKERRKDK